MNADEAAIKAIDRYVEYLNVWLEKDEWSRDRPFRYSRDSFTVYAPDRQLWGAYTVYAFQLNVMNGSGAFNRAMHVMSLSDGDEGGPTDLLTVFEQTDEAKDEWDIIYMVQGFDTMLHAIVNETDHNDLGGTHDVPIDLDRPPGTSGSWGEA